MQVKLLSILMGWKCLPHYSRIELWRNTLMLFHTIRDYTGPFKKAGYDNYLVEHHINKQKTGEDLSPDIMAFGPNGWLVLDITANDKSKEFILDEYYQGDPRNLDQYGVKQQYDSPPETICSRLNPIDDGDHCQIIVKDIFDVKKENFIKDTILRNELIKAKGDNLKNAPNISISLVPEMSKDFEIRGGLIDIVMQLYTPNCEGKTAYEMCELALDKLFDKVPFNARNSLTTKIDKHMKILVDTDLKGYLEYKNGRYCSTSQFKEHAKTLDFVQKRIIRWASCSTLGNFGVDDE